MKITIAPSEDQSAEQFPYYAITVENGNDDGCTIETVLNMFHQAMIGWGYGSDEIVKNMNQFKP